MTSTTIPQDTTIVDVRTPEEFNAGHVPGSINIPLSEVPNRIEDFRSLPKPLVICCRSGVRSGNAVAFLERQGISEMENGGGWQEVLQRMRK